MNNKSEKYTPAYWKSQGMLRPGSVLWITVCAFFMALTIVLSSFSVPVPGGHLYLCDAAIVTGAILLDPLGAMLFAGLGTFFGDALFYPAPMWVSLITHGLQALVISWIAHHFLPKKPFVSALAGSLAGLVILVGGYTLGRTFVYANWQTALLKLPWEIVQGGAGIVIGLMLDFGFGLRKTFQKLAGSHSGRV